MSLTYSHRVRKVKTSPKGVTTAYFFEVWTLDVPASLTEVFSNSPDIVVVDNLQSIKTPFHVADHCQTLFVQPEEELILPECSRIRVSMSVLVDLRINNLHALLLEKNCLKPFGGALHFNSLPNIPSISLDDRRSKDLRLSLDLKDCAQLIEWYLTQKDREITPQRELFEELCLESSILNQAQWIELKNSF